MISIKDLKTDKLGNLTSLITRGISPKYSEGEGQLVLNQKCIRDNRINIELARNYDKNQRVKKGCILEVGDVLINSTGIGTLSRSAIVKDVTENMTLDSHVTLVRTKKDIADAKYIGYHVELLEPVIENFAGGSTGQTELSRKDVYNLDIIIHELPTQQRIASILSAYDDLIEVNNQRIKLLEETTRELYKEWFVRMRFPGYKKAKFVKGVPEGWEMKKLKECCGFKYGTMPKQELIKETGFPIFSGYGIVGFYEKYMFKDKTLIVVARGVGGTGDIKLTPLNCWLTNLAIAIFPDNINLIKYFLYYTLSAIDLRYLDSGSAQSQITIADLGNLKLLVPNFELQRRFEEIIIPIEEQLENLQQQNAQLRQIRDRLLPRLISGKLEVKPNNF